MVKRYRAAGPKQPRPGYCLNAAGQEVRELSERTPIKCPACDDLGLRRIMAENAQSRYVNTWICNECGIKEAMQGFFWQAKAMNDPRVNKFIHKDRR